MNDSTQTSSASGKTNPTKVVLRAQTWAAEASISGRGDYHCVSFFRFPPCFLGSPQLQWFTVLPSLMEGGKCSYIRQGEPTASILLMPPSHSRSVWPVHTGLSDACLEAMPSAALWSIAALFPISFCDACPISICNAKSLLFCPTLDLILLAAATGGHGILKAQESLSSPGKLKMLACCILLLNK